MRSEIYQGQLCFPWSTASQALTMKVAKLEIQEERPISRSYLKLRKEITSCADYNSQGRAVHLQIRKQFIVIFDRTSDQVIDLFESSPETSVLVREVRNL